ncbi:hypothetical protein Bca4012_067502 [Brassica carinata]
MIYHKIISKSNSIIKLPSLSHFSNSRSIFPVPHFATHSLLLPHQFSQNTILLLGNGSSSLRRTCFCDKEELARQIKSSQFDKSKTLNNKYVSF